MDGFPFDTIGFDLDGTLVDTAPDLGRAVNHALAQIGREPVSGEVTRELIGGGTRAMLTRALERTGGMVGVEEFAALVMHMVENRYINGETVRIDGALRMAPK